MSDMEMTVVRWVFVGVVAGALLFCACVAADSIRLDAALYAKARAADDDAVHERNRERRAEQVMMIENGGPVAIMQRESLAARCLVCGKTFEDLAGLSAHVAGSGHTIEYIERGVVMPPREAPDGERN